MCDTLSQQPIFVCFFFSHRFFFPLFFALFFPFPGLCLSFTWPCICNSAGNVYRHSMAMRSLPLLNQVLGERTMRWCHGLTTADPSNNSDNLTSHVTFLTCRLYTSTPPHFLLTRIKRWSFLPGLTPSTLSTHQLTHWYSTTSDLAHWQTIARHRGINSTQQIHDNGGRGQLPGPCITPLLNSAGLYANLATLSCNLFLVFPRQAALWHHEDCVDSILCNYNGLPIRQQIFIMAPFKLILNRYPRRIRALTRWLSSKTVLKAEETVSSSQEGTFGGLFQLPWWSR